MCGDYAVRVSPSHEADLLDGLASLGGSDGLAGLVSVDGARRVPDGSRAAGDKLAAAEAILAELVDRVDGRRGRSRRP